MTVTILVGDALTRLRELPADSVDCCVTSPPYWGLRDYGVPPSVWGGKDNCDHEWGDTIVERATNHTDKRRWQHTRNGRDEEQPTEKRVAWLRSDIPQGQFCQRCGAWAGAHGLEPSYELFVANETTIFREVRRVLKPEGTLWLNLGDSYATGAGKVGERPGGGKQGDAWNGHRGSRSGSAKQPHTGNAIGPMTQPNRLPQPGLKAKDLCGMPWRVAFSLQADGWYLRQDIIWSKPNPMPESIKDRCTKAHEYLFLLARSPRYYFDALAIAEPAVGLNAHDLTGGPYSAPGQTPHNGSRASWKGSEFHTGKTGVHQLGRAQRRPKGNARGGGSYVGGQSFDNSTAAERDSHGNRPNEAGTRNRRSVWEVATAPFSEAHFATFPPDLIEPCILAGCPVGGTVLDPFGGAGTTGLVADRLQRDAILIELNPEYAEMARRRIDGDRGGLLDAMEAAA